MIAHVGYWLRIGKSYLGFPLCIGFWRHIELVCDYMGSAGFFLGRVTRFYEQVGDVVVHGDLSRAFVIVPGEVYACI